MNTFHGNVYVIGAGGVGSWLIPSLCKLISPDRVMVCDGDRLEPKNLDRQFYKQSDIGKNKAAASAALYGCRSCEQYYTAGMLEFVDNDFLICCADNDPARIACLESVDRYGCSTIIAANEKHSAEAYFYYLPLRETRFDPRVYYPHLLTNKDNDPRAAAIGCTGEAQVQSPQLVSANFMAASLAQWLFVLWGLMAPELSEQTIARLPYHLIGNMSSLETRTLKADEKTKEREVMT